MDNATHVDLSLFIVKIAGACNLNCSYCYVYNKGDQTYRERPTVMSDATFGATVNRIRRHCERTGRRSVRVTLHGGEPMMVRPLQADAWFTLLKDALDPVDVHLTIQTNATLITPEWVGVINRHQINVGVSIDGPEELHDLHRVDKSGRGSHGRVLRGLEQLRAAGIGFGLLCVVPLGAADPLAVHSHLMSLGPHSVSYLLPDFTHDTISDVRRDFGPTPCADFLLPILDVWITADPPAPAVGLFRRMIVLILGGDPAADIFGNGPLGFAVVETDGAIESLDCLRVCEEGITRTGLNVHRDDFEQIAELGEFHRNVLVNGTILPTECTPCPERNTCGGGYLPHRYSASRAFDNPSVWCEDLKLLFARLRHLLDVDVSETQLRRQVLHELATAPEAMT